MSQTQGTVQPQPQPSPQISTEALKQRLMFIGMILLVIGFFIGGLGDIAFISFRANLFTVMTLLEGLLLIGIAAILFMRLKYILSYKGNVIDLFFDEPMLKFITYLAPLYMLFKGIGFFGGNLIVGIGLTVAGILFLILVVLYQMYRYRGIPPTMMLLFSIFIIIVGVFLSVAGFISAGSSGPNVFLAHSGILGIAVILIGIGLIIIGFTGQHSSNIIKLILNLGYLLASIALIVGGGLGIRDGISVLGAAFFPASLKAVGGLILVAEVMALIAGIMFLIIIIVNLGKELSKAAAAPPPPPAPPPPETPPPPPQ